MAPVPASLLHALSISDPSKASLSTAGLGSGFTSTGAIRATVPSADGQYEVDRQYFVKTSANGKAAEEMFRGEYESLNAIANSVPGFCPRALAWGPLEESNGKSFYLATEFLDLGGGGRTGQSLAQRLGKLHSTPAPLDPKTGKRQFGFPVPTFCGDTKQPNRFHDSWADFYANERLMTILETSEKRNGRDASLRDLVERTAHTVVPALLGDGHLGYDRNGNGEGITPAVVHGDLWSGNADRGRIVGGGCKGDAETGDVVYDPSACYAHSEYELGIMKMFGGFGPAFFTAYHKIVPRTEPVEEYEDRVRLYELMVPEKKDGSNNQAASETSIPEPPSIHPSFIQVAKPYIFEQTIQQCIAAMGVNPLREEGLRLQGVTWIDNVRRVLYLYDAAAAALFTACKIEDTLKKSREIVCAAYNLKLPPSEHISPDNPVFEVHARGIIGLERLMLEASGFDFRTRHPQKTLIKLARHYGLTSQSQVSNVAYRISQDLYRTFAPIKQTASTMAFTCLELAGRLLDQRIEAVELGVDYEKWRTSREEVMETLFDLLELYTHSRGSTSVGPHFPADRFLTVRIPLNKEAEAQGLPRYTHWVNESRDLKTANGAKSGKEPALEKAGARLHPLTPVAANGERPRAGEKGRDGAVRFMLDSECADAEKTRVSEYFKVEMEEYEVEE
ncbi:Fructosamine kinase-domain-containing protein [Aspergillus tamarii]|uniref:protein-ribulosamine 3-kinase n=1 Tax=Aspergillus tamarii TaxID=41984 RepID=A0A5N6UFX1_ASPTM|nr:Fructosamine kinase-domain-containing protein [Aspergillus tamarii]